MPDGNLPGRDHLATDVRQHIQKEPAPAAARSTCQETGTSCQETGTSCQEKARGEGEASGQKGTGRQEETSRQEGKSSSIKKGTQLFSTRKELRPIRKAHATARLALPGRRLASSRRSHLPAAGRGAA